MKREDISGRRGTHRNMELLTISSELLQPTPAAPVGSERDMLHTRTAHSETQARTVSAHAEQTTMPCQFSTRVHCTPIAVRLPTHGRRARCRLTGNWDSCDVGGSASSTSV